MYTRLNRKAEIYLGRIADEQKQQLCPAEYINKSPENPKKPLSTQFLYRFLKFGFKT